MKSLTTLRLAKNRNLYVTAGLMGIILILGIGGVTIARSQERLSKTSHKPRTVQNTQNKQVQVAATEPSSQADMSPSVTPAKATPPPALQATSPTTATTDQFCLTIRGSTMKPQCSTRDLTIFRVASVILWPNKLSCTENTIRVDFNPLETTRHYKTGGAGTAQVIIEYSDGSPSTPVTVQFPRVTGNVQQTAGLFHIFTVDPDNIPNDLSYRVNVVGTDSASQPWMPISENLGTPEQPTGICYQATYFHNGPAI